jgi:hypothetical protein
MALFSRYVRGMYVYPIYVSEIHEGLSVSLILSLEHQKSPYLCMLMYRSVPLCTLQFSLDF